MLAGQLAALPASYRPDVAVIVVGGNDVTHRVPVAESVRHLEEAIADLRARGAEVVVGSCPDLGALRPVPQPLRALGSRASRQLAQAQEAAAVRRRRARGVAGPRRRAVLHHQPRRDVQPRPVPPQRAGYKRTAKALLPSVLAALGLEDDVPFGHRRPGAGRAGLPIRPRGPPARLDTGHRPPPAEDPHDDQADQAARLAQLAVRPGPVRAGSRPARVVAAGRLGGRLAGRPGRPARRPAGRARRPLPDGPRQRGRRDRDRLRLERPDVPALHVRRPARARRVGARGAWPPS